MLNKLIKHDLKSLFRTLTPLYLILFLMALFNRVAVFASDKISMLKIPAGFIIAFYFILLIGIPIATFVITIIRYYNNLVKDEGYLMHTLPVKKSNLILSKLISYFIVILTSTIVFILGLLIGCVGVYFEFDALKKFFEAFKQVDTLFIVLMVLSMITALFLNQLMVYLSIALGQKHNNNKLLYSFVYGIVIYNVVQIVSTVLILLPMIFNSDWFKYLDSDMPPMNILNGFIGASCGISIIITFVLYYFTKKTMETKLNLE